MPGSSGKMSTTGAVLEPIHRGWLTKSPPEPKLMSPWRFLVRAVGSQKWRRRYFVLHKPPGSLPDHFALDYFEDETLNKRLGTIDLELTEEIVSPLNSSQYDYLFLIKTKFKRKDRRYFLAVDTEDEMNKWIDCLCQVCGLKEQEEAADPAGLVPPTEEAVSALSRPATTPHSQPADNNLNVRSSIGGSYVKLDTCFSKSEDLEPVDVYDTLSIPDIPPPPVPNEDYDIPPRRTSDEAVYKVPPRREDVYDVPPSVLSEPREDNPDDFYDVPPPPIRTEFTVTTGPPVAPPRPPKPYDIGDSDQQYINLAGRKNSSSDPFGAPPPPPRPSLHDSVYDVPPSANSLLSISPPAPGIISVGPGAHSYVNTEKAKNNSYMSRENDQSTYDVLFRRSPAPPPAPVPVEGRKRSDSEDVYQVPPSNRPVHEEPPPTPVRPENTLTKHSKPIEQNTCEVFSTSRTTSFRRAGAKMTPSPKPRNRQQGHAEPASSEGAFAPLGVPVRVTHSSCSSSEDDMDDPPCDLDQPVAAAGPASRKDAQLQYLDLDLASRGAPKPEQRVPKHGAPANSQTEYKEIDFVKTHALSKAKQALETDNAKRKNSDASFRPHLH